MADVLAAEGSKEAQEGISWSYNIAEATIKREYKKRIYQHERMRNTYEGESIDHKEEATIGREESVKWTRFRLGHSLELEQYRRRIGKTESGLCRLCEEEEETNIHVLLKCPAMEATRRSEEIVGLGDMCGKWKRCRRIWQNFKKRIKRIATE